MRTRIKRLSELGENGVEGEGGIEVPKKVGIMRELRVIRVGPNPRMVVCEYKELASRRVCTVNVKVNRKWRKGMVFEMEEPRGEGEYNRPWEYKGVGPRRAGRW